MFKYLWLKLILNSSKIYSWQCLNWNTPMECLSKVFPFPFCEMASFLFLGKGGAQPVVWSTLVHCPTVALKTNWVKIHWCRVFQSVPTPGENKCDKWARLNLHSRLITLQKQLARRTVFLAMDGETETGNAVEMGLASKSTHIPFPISCMNPPQSELSSVRLIWRQTAIETSLWQKMAKHNAR